MVDREKVINYRKNGRSAFKWWLYSIGFFAILIIWQGSDQYSDLSFLIVIDVILGVIFFVTAVIYSIFATIIGPVEIVDERYKEEYLELIHQIEKLLKGSELTTGNEGVLKELSTQLRNYKDEILQSRYTIENLTTLLESNKYHYNESIADISARLKEAQEAAVAANEEAGLWKQTLIEKSSGFPTLLTNISYFEELRDANLSGFLRRKPHPAKKACELVKEETRKRRLAEYNLRKTQAIIDYYENIAPFLLDFKDQLIEDDERSFEDYSIEEAEDPVTKYLTKEEYRKLTSIEKNALALQRFWDRPKSKWLIGRLYERYIGYLYEIEGYDVEYVGIFQGYEDLGRDLICTKGKNVIIIQCKCWSQFKTIYEKHIFQFFGTVFEYRDKYKEKNVLARFYTSTKVSDLARRFASELRIELVENFKLPEKYPCIKCNVSRVNGEKIYHLPFDQQYDNTKVEKKRGELYCNSVEEAESLGFRRAFRWSGSTEQ